MYRLQENMCVRWGTVNNKHEEWLDENNAELQQLTKAKTSMLSRNT